MEKSSIILSINPKREQTAIKHQTLVWNYTLLRIKNE